MFFFYENSFYFITFTLWSDTGMSSGCHWRDGRECRHSFPRALHACCCWCGGRCCGGRAERDGGGPTAGHRLHTHPGEEAEGQVCAWGTHISWSDQRLLYFGLSPCKKLLIIIIIIFFFEGLYFQENFIWKTSIIINLWGNFELPICIMSSKCVECKYITRPSLLLFLIIMLFCCRIQIGKCVVLFWVYVTRSSSLHKLSSVSNCIVLDNYVDLKYINLFLCQGLHSASIPGILSLDVHQKDTSKVVTGGADKNATVFNKDTEQVGVVNKI